MLNTRMDVKMVSWKKLKKILFKPDEWQMVEFHKPFQMIETHIVGAIMVNTWEYEVSLKLLNVDKKILVIGPYFETLVYYHFLKQHHYQVYLLGKKPNVLKYKRNI